LSTTERTGFNADALGKWTDEVRFTVEAERAIAYAKATNDDNPRHLSGELAPPVFAVVPVWDTLGPAIFDVAPPELMMGVVHGEQDMFFSQPVRPGMELVSRAAPVGIHSVSRGVTVTTKIECRTADGAPVNEQWMTSFFRGADEEIDVGETPPVHRVEASDRSPEPLATVKQGYDSDQTFRYSDASGDMMPVHLDEEVAKAVGLPGIIVHGLCTMAFNSRAIIAEACGGDPERLKRLAVRFSKPAMPGEEIATTIWSAGERHGHTAVAFESVSSSEQVVIKDGLAEVAGA
jgi:acyl dehydratase